MIVSVTAKIANFGNRDFEQTEEKNAFSVRMINVIFPSKDEESGYYNSRPWKVVAGGKMAERLSGFVFGDSISITGRVDIETYVNKDGEQKENYVIYPVEMSFKDNNNGSNASAKSLEEPEKPTAPKKATPPVTGSKKKTLPKLAKK